MGLNCDGFEEVMVELFPAGCWAGWFSNQNEQRALVSHGPLWTYVTNFLVSVISRVGNSFGLSWSVIKTNLLFTSEMLLFTGWRLQICEVIYIWIRMMNSTLYLKIED